MSAKPSPILLVRMGCISFVVHLYFPVPKPTTSSLHFQPCRITCIFLESKNHVSIMSVPLPSIVSSHFALQAVFGCLVSNSITSFGCVKVKVLVAQSCPTLCEPMHCSSPGFSVNGILQARILEWVVISLFRESSQTRNPKLSLLH